MIPTLIRSCVTKELMPLVSGPVHDFVDVEDLVDALLLIEAKGLFEGEVYEIGTGKQTTNNEIKDMVEEEMGLKANLKITKNLRNYDTKTWKANPEKILSLGWKPKRTIRDSIRRMIADYWPGV